MKEEVKKKRIRKGKKIKREMGGGGLTVKIFLGVGIFSIGVEIFSGGRVENFRGVRFFLDEAYINNYLYMENKYLYNFLTKF